MSFIIEPKIITVFREGYSFKKLLSDISAGFVVGIVAIPLAIAFAIASGVKPEQGLYTAIIAGFIISLLSGSRVQIGGPTGAFVVLVYAIVQKYGYDALVITTIMAGFLLVGMSLLKLGVVIKYIPYPVTVGFTAGIAVIIAVGQIRDMLGLNIESIPADFVGKIQTYATQIQTINIYAFCVFLVSVLIILLWPKVNKRIPGSIIAIILATVCVKVFNIPVETIYERFGNIAQTLPAPTLPKVNFQIITEMFPEAFSLALLAGIESLLSAVVADGMLGTKHRSNTELMAQGIANIITPIFGGIPATGAIARTATNIKNGGRTPIAGIAHALTVLLVLVVLGKWASLIPMATIAAVLMVVSYNMSEMHRFVKMFKYTKSDIVVMLATFSLTVLIDLVVALEVGMVLALFLFMRRMSEVTKMNYVSTMMDDETEEDSLSVDVRDIPEGIEIFEINGPFFFGAADRFKDTISSMEKKPRILILRMRKVLSIDATALNALEYILEKSKEGEKLLLSGVHTQPLVAMEKSGFLKRVGSENVFATIEDALKYAKSCL